MTKKTIDWTLNKSWFNIKLLTQFGTTDNEECINDSTYSNAVKKYAKKTKLRLNIASTLVVYLVHLRVKLMKMIERKSVI